MHLRSEWTIRQPSWSPARRGVGDIFIHHEGGASRGVPKDKGAVLREIESGVLGKGYIAIDYNIMVFNDGDIWEGRGLQHEDGATINNNPTSVSICAVGNYERENASNSLVMGIAEACRLTAASGWASPHPTIHPHREVFATACPGANLFRRMDDIRARFNSPSIPTGDDDLTPTQATQLQYLFDLFGKGGKLDWLIDIELPLGWDKRSQAGNSPRTQTIANDIAAIKKKLGI